MRLYIEIRSGVAPDYDVFDPSRKETNATLERAWQNESGIWNFSFMMDGGNIRVEFNTGKSNICTHPYYQGLVDWYLDNHKAWEDLLYAE